MAGMIRWRVPLVPAVLFLTGSAVAQVPSPKEFFGHDICEDYWLANYKDLTRYWQALAKASPRARVVSMGKTEFGREQWMTIISDPLNLKYLERHRKVSQKFSYADFATDEMAREAAKKAKSVVWIDGGLHANEVLGAQQLIETACQLVSRTDAENNRILKDTIILLVHANPDGMDLVSDWYMRQPVARQRSLANIPELYQKYGGHDNNRDFYAMNMAETRNMNRVLYETWHPQVVYNHHQSAPSGTIMFIPPFRNPFNYHVDPIIQTATDVVGLNMHQRLISEGLGGTVMREGASFSAWWNGGLRTTTYFHNQVGILTETWGSPNPTPVPFLTERQIPSIDLPKPVDVRQWHLKDSLQYEIQANYAILDYASRYREKLLFSVYRAGKNSIERGLKDYWTRYPSRIRELKAEALSKPELRDARSYVIPRNQENWGAACRFAEALLRTGVRVEQLRGEQFGYPAGSLVVQTAQPYRPHVLDMFEPQDYPNDFRYPGGPPIAPYDNAGYTLAYQMGVKFDRVLEERAYSAMPITSAKNLMDRSGQMTDSVVLPAGENESFAIANLALKEGLKVERSAAGAFAVSGNAEKLSNILKSRSYGRTTQIMDRSATSPVKPVRIALWDRYGGSMPSGWTRWLFDEFGFNYEVVYGNDLDTADLAAKYDVILFPSGAVPGQDSTRAATNPLEDDPTVSAEHKRRWANISVSKTMPRLKAFVEAGGHVIGIGSSAGNLAKHLGLPVMSALQEDGKPLPDTKFYIPGSVLSLRLNPGPLTVGYSDKDLDVIFDDSPAFLLPADAPVSPVATFVTDKPLRSGWAWGQERLKGTTAIVDVSLGKGKVVLFGPEVNFRGQSHGSFKLLFNAIFRAGK